MTSPFRVRLGRRALAVSSVVLLPLAAVAGLSSPASAAGPTVTASPSSVTAGGSVTATWSDIASPTATDWVALYPSGTTSNVEYEAWAYTSGGASGTLALTVPPGAPSASTYELRLFTNDTYTVLATSGSFAVSGATPSAALLSASPTTVSAGSPVTATWSAIASPSAKDWVALFSSGSSSSIYPTWAYTGGAASGTLNLTVPSGTPSGEYELRLFSNDTYFLLATSNLFTISADQGDLAMGAAALSVATETPTTLKSPTRQTKATAVKQSTVVKQERTVVAGRGAR